MPAFSSQELESKTAVPSVIEIPAEMTRIQTTVRSTGITWYQCTVQWSVLFAELLSICRLQEMLASYVPSGMQHWTTQVERHAEVTSHANDQ